MPFAPHNATQATAPMTPILTALDFIEALSSRRDRCVRSLYTAVPNEVPSGFDPCGQAGTLWAIRIADALSRVVSRRMTTSPLFHTSTLPATR